VSARPGSAGAVSSGGGRGGLAATGMDAYGRPQTAVPSSRREAAGAARVGGTGGASLSTHTKRMAAAAAVRRRREAGVQSATASATASSASASGRDASTASHTLLLRIGKELSRQSHRYQAVFKKMKTHGELGVDADDLAWGLEREGVRVSEAEADALVEAFDRSGNGALGYGDFLHLVNSASDTAGGR